MSPPRIQPKEPPYAPELAEMLAKWMPPGAGIDPLKLFRTLGHNLPLAEAMRGVGSYMLGKRLSVSMKERELIIDRVCARCGCEYEWGVHAAAFGAAAGLSPEEVGATVEADADDPVWGAREALLIRLADELHDTSTVSDSLWSALSQHYQPPQLLELLVLVGWYHIIAFVCNGTGVALEDWATRFPLNAE